MITYSYVSILGSALRLEAWSLGEVRVFASLLFHSLQDRRLMIPVYTSLASGNTMTKQLDEKHHMSEVAELVLIRNQIRKHRQIKYPLAILYRMRLKGGRSRGNSLLSNLCLAA